MEKSKIKKEKLELFELKGTLRFYARDLDDAFEQIGKYYLALSRGENIDPFEAEPGTDIELEVVKDH